MYATPAVSYSGISINPPRSRKKEVHLQVETSAYHIHGYDTPLKNIIIIEVLTKLSSS